MSTWPLPYTTGRAPSVGLCLLALSACGGEPGLIVTITDWPIDVVRVHIQTRLGDQLGEDLQIPAGKDRFVIRMPAGGEGQLFLNATARDAGDCQLARGELTASLVRAAGLQEGTIELVPLDPPTCTLTLGRSDGGILQIPTSGEDCHTPNLCQAEIWRGAQLSPSAYPDSGARYLVWSGDCEGTDRCSVRMDRARTVFATFPTRSCSPDSWCRYSPLLQGGQERFADVATTFNRGAFVVGARGRVLNCVEEGCRSLSSGTTNNLVSIVAYNSYAWAVGARGSLIACDWYAECKPLDSRTTSDLESLSLHEYPNTLWAAGQNGTALRCTNGTCSLLQTSLSVPLRGISGTETTAWVVGDNGTVLSCSTTTCTKITSNTTETLRSVIYLGSTAWAVGDNGMVLSCTGTVCTKVTSNTSNQLTRAFVGRDGGTLWVAGATGTVLKCSGTTCTLIPTTTQNTLRGIGGDLRDFDRVWIAGDAGTLLSCKDSSCTTMVTDTAVNFTGVGSEGASDVWVVGEASTILRHPRE